MAFTSKTFRIFVSSTFSDLKEERNALQKKVFPELRKLCMLYGFRFQAIDLRWGVSEKASQNHETMRICLREIKRCQSVSPRPNFIVLLGDRYGWQPIPEEIPADEFVRIKKTIEIDKHEFSSIAIELLDRWYREDRNAVPSVYILQPVEPGTYPEGKWNEQVQIPLLKIIRKAVDKLDLRNEEKLKYFASATHQEIENGAMQVEDAEEHVFGFFRQIENLDDLKKELPEEPANYFVDTDSERKCDDAAHNKLTATKKNLEDKLGKDNIFPYNVRWENHNITTDHIDKLCEDVYNSLSKVILKEAEKVERIDDLEKEIDNHNTFGLDRARFFVGRTKILNEIENYVGKGQNHPLVIYGESGSGKSALMAKAAEQLHNKYSIPEYVVRFIGATPGSSDIRSLLETICKQISRLYGADEADIPGDYQKLIEEFPRRLALATLQKPLVLFLDALDQLSDANNDRNFNWLPTELPEYVHLVVSILPGSGYEILKQNLPLSNLLELTPMPAGEGEALLDLWLKNINRTLTKEQRDEILKHFGMNDNGKPLYLRLAFEEARRWKSYTPYQETKLRSDISGIIQDLFKRLSSEKNHGEMLVSRSMGYIAAGKNGLSEDELIDVLSCDEEFFQDFLRRSFHKPPENRLPVIVWSRLYFDLEPYLIERSADGTSLMSFYHPTTFGTKVREEYLSGETKMQRHRQLAKYFEKQDLYREKQNTKTSNLRKLSELPYQQTLGESWDGLEETLTDLYFIEAKCASGMTYNLIADYSLALRLIPEAQEKNRKEQEHVKRIEKYIQDLIAYSKDEIKNLEIIPSVKPWSRNEIMKDNERIINNPTRMDRIRAFSQFVNSESNALVKFAFYPGFCLQQAYNFAYDGPVTQQAENIAQYEKNTVLLLHHKSKRPVYNLHTAIQMTIEGHTDIINSVSITPNGKKAISGSKDKEVRLWDLEKGMCLNTLTGHKSSVNSVCLTMDGKKAVSGSFDKTLKVWDLESGHCLNTFEGHTDWIQDVKITPDGWKAVSGGIDKTLRIWDLRNGECLRSFEGPEGKITSVCITPDGKKAVVASGVSIKIWDIESGKCRKTFKGHESIIEGYKSKICDISISKNGKKLISASHEKDKTLKVWDMESGECFTTLKGHIDLINCVSISPDGKKALTGSYDNSLKLWDLQNAKCMNTLEGHAAFIASVMFTPDGRRAVSASADKSLRVWDIDSEKCLKILKGHQDVVDCVTVTLDGKKAVSGSWDRTLKVWDIDTGQCLNTLEGHTDWIQSVDTYQDGKKAVSGSKDKTLRIWDLEKGKCVKILKSHSDSVTSLSISPDGRTVISGGIDKILNIWDIEKGKSLMTIEGHIGPVHCVDITPNLTKIISGSADKTLRVWDAKNKKCLKTLVGHKEKVSSVCITPDGRKALSGSMDRTVRLWDLVSGECMSVLSGHSGEVNSVNFTPDAKIAVSAGRDKTIKIWDIESGECLKTLVGDTDTINDVSITPDGRTAVSGGFDKNLKIWDIESGESLKTVNEHAGDVRSLSITSDRKRVISSGIDRTLRIWERESGECLKILSGHNDEIRSVKLTPDGKWIISGSKDNTLRIWDMESGKCLKSFEEHGDFVGSINISPDGKRVLYSSKEKVDSKKSDKEKINEGSSSLTSSFKQYLRVWDIKNDKYLKNLEGHKGTIESILLTSDGKRLVSCSADNTLKVWDLESGKCMKTLEGHTLIVEKACITPDAKRVVSASWDKTLKVWDLEKGKCLKTLKGHTGFIWSLSLTPDGRIAVSGSEDKTFRLWDLKKGECLKIIEGHTDRINSVKITPDGKMALSESEDGAIKLWNLKNWECLAVYHNQDKVTVSSEIRAAFCYVCGFNSGKVIIFTPRNYPMILPLITAQRIWVYGETPNSSFWDKNINAVCAWCGEHFVVSTKIISIIESINRKTKLSSKQSPCLDLPEEAWDEPGLLSECPFCRRPLKYNPFIVDNRNHWWKFWHK